MEHLQDIKVKELKEELKKRGAKTSGRKHELLERLNAYKKLEIRPSVAAPETQVLQLPDDCSFQDLSYGYKDKIGTTNVHLMDYFIFRKSEIDGAPVTNYKSLCDAGYRLFSEKFITFIKCAFESNNVYINSRVKSEYTKHKSYGIKLILATQGVIKGAECECIAGAGPTASCKHIAAVSYALEHFSKNGEIKCLETCTQTLQTFHHPCKRQRPISPIKVENLPLGHVSEACNEVRPSSGINKSGYQHYVETLVKTSKHKLTFSYAIKKEKVSALDVIHDHYYGVDPCSSEAEKLVAANEEQRKQIEKNTREQSNQALWFRERKYRLTASNFGKICHTKNPKKLVEVLLKGNTFCSANMQWGLQMENEARLKYSAMWDHVVKQCGLIIHPTKHYLAASCDGLIGEDRVLELKGVPSHAYERIAVDYIPYLEVNNGDVVLKKTHNYYFQVQGQLFVTGRQYCSFAIYTSVDMLVLDIEREEIFIQEMEEKLDYFYKTYFVPAILK